MKVRKPTVMKETQAEYLISRPYFDCRIMYMFPTKEGKIGLFESPLTLEKLVAVGRRRLGEYESECMSRVAKAKRGTK